MATKYIFVTGGVVSSLGKGITVASIGRLLKSRGVSVSIQKLDPYINVDPGTMSPYQHGEVFVTQDGAETDLDLGHYERFTNEALGKLNNVTTGQIYWSVIERERRGDYLGGTIQLIPHITDELKARIRSVGEQSGADVVIVEVGGTVGDMEGLPFLEAIRQMRNDLGRQNVLYIHLTLVPHLSTTNELKTKPTQQSVQELRRIGITPDIIVCRSDHELPDDIREKIALYSGVPANAIIPLPTVDEIYEVPLILERAGLGRLLVDELALPSSEPLLSDWSMIVQRLKQAHRPVRIALVGKYVQLHDAYLSVTEALRHACAFHRLDLDLKWVNSEDLETGRPARLLGDIQGLVVPGGFGPRGVRGKCLAAQFARTNRIPYLGLCLGLQCAVIEFARNVLGLSQADSTEFDPDTPDPVIDYLPGQEADGAKGGTMRLGNYPCELTPGTHAAAAYGQARVHERHRHRFEVKNRYRERLAAHGLIGSGISPDGELVEMIELRDHPWFVATQFHPEFASRPNHPHPLFRDFVRACRQQPLDGTQQELPLGQTVELMATESTPS